METDGIFLYCQFNRLTIPAEAQKRLGIYQGWGKTPAENKEKFYSIPKEAKRLPYIISADNNSRLVLMFHPECDAVEVIKGLEALLWEAKQRWKYELAYKNYGEDNKNDHNETDNR